MCSVFLLGGSLRADEPPDDETAFQAVASRVTQSPLLDGNVLEDPAYSDAVVITDFTQNAPFEGQPASERTEVRIVYTDRVLYVGVVAYDREPNRIVVTDSRRDGELDETDSFRMLFDTFNDDQNGFVFGTNPMGMEYDAQVDNNGQGNFVRAGQGGGAIGGFNLNWDGSWEVETRITEIGWEAEFAIPFRTLRFASAEAEQTWGLNFQRNVRRRNERSFWTPLPRQFDLNRVSLAGSLSGLELRSPRNLKITPYVLGQASREELAADFEDDLTGDFGADLKYSITPSMTLDLTYNTDFAQVEVDEQQINLDRFNLFFPEKRPFFLENAGFFSVGAPGEVELFFSRRIGIGPGGQAIPILGGARLSGKAGNSNIGVLNMQTREVGGVTPANNYTVTRFEQELPNRSAVGVLFNNRVSMGDLAPEDDYNRAFAVDGRLGVGENGEVSAFVARTQTPGLDGGQYAYQVFSRYDSRGWMLNLGYTEVSETFNPELGFLSRGAYRKAEALIFRRIRPENLLSLHEIRPHTSARSYWNFDGFHETLFWHIDSHWEFRSGYEIHTGFNITREGVIRPFQIFPGITVPADTYDHIEAQIVGMTNQGADVSANFRSVIGGFFGGNRASNTVSLTARLSDRFTSEVSYNRNDVNLPVGDFTTNLLLVRASYSFTPRLFTQGLFQYNDRADLWSANLRVGWLQAANTGLYVVYNETNFDGGLGNRSVIVKYSRIFDVLR